MVDKKNSSARERAESFANRLGIRLPILLAPMAGACPPSLSIAVANAGGLGACGARVPPEAGDVKLPDFEAQCQAVLTVAPKAMSSIMGLYAPGFVAELKAWGILWFATATTVAEAKAAEAAGADA